MQGCRNISSSGIGTGRAGCTKGCNRGDILCGNHRGNGPIAPVAPTYSVVAVAPLTTLLGSPAAKETACPQAIEIAVAPVARFS